MSPSTKKALKNRVFVLEIGNQGIKRKVQTAVKRAGGIATEDLLAPDDKRCNLQVVISDHRNLARFLQLKAQKRRSSLSDRATPSSLPSIGAPPPSKAPKNDRRKSPSPTKKRPILRRRPRGEPNENDDPMRKVILSLPITLREAYNLGLEIVPSDKFDEFLLKQTDQALLQLSPHKDNRNNVPKCRTFHSNYIKVDDLGGKFAPMYSELLESQWCPIYVTACKTKSFFHPPVDCSLRRSPRKALSKQVEEHDDSGHGFCELCKCEYSDATKHLNSIEHGRCVVDGAYVCIDRELKCLNDMNLLRGRSLINENPRGSELNNELMEEENSEPSIVY